MNSPIPLQQSDAARQHVEQRVLTGALSAEYALRQPLTVQVWPEDTVFVAATDEIDVHAFGDSLDAAVEALRDAVVEHVSRLEAADDRLSPRMIRERDALRSLVQRRNA